MHRYRRGRASERGAIMVEALVVITLLVLFFTGVGHFRAVYLEKLRVQRLGRAATLTHAMGACASDPRAAIGASLGRRDVEEVSGSGIPFDVIPFGGSDKGSVALQQLRDKNGDTGLDKVTSLTVSGKKNRFTQPPPEAAEPAPLLKVSSTSFVVCADPTPDDRYEGMVEQIAKLF